MKSKYYRMRDGTFMERIKIKKDYQEKVIVKFQREKISIKPYIDCKDASEIMLIVTNNYYKEGIDRDTRYLSSAVIEYSYALAVAKVMTNISAEEKDDMNLIVNSGFIDVMKNTIKNYKDILENVYFSIDQENKYENFQDIQNLLDDTIYQFKTLLDKSSNDIDDGTNKLKDDLKQVEQAMNKPYIKEVFMPIKKDDNVTTDKLAVDKVDDKIQDSVEVNIDKLQQEISKNEQVVDRDNKVSIKGDIALKTTNKTKLNKKIK